MNGMNGKNNFDINLGGATLANQATGTAKKDDKYINLNCYMQRPEDDKPTWLFQASCVVSTKKATESILKKVAKELLNNKKKEKHEDAGTGEITLVETEIAEPIEFTFIEGNMKQEKPELDELF